MKHEANSVLVDSRHNMYGNIITKWKHVLTIIMANGHYKHFFNGITSQKDKWESLYGDYNINGYKSVTSHNEDYQDISTKDKLVQGLPKNFNRCMKAHYGVQTKYNEPT